MKTLRNIALFLGVLVLLGLIINIGGFANGAFYYPTRTTHSLPASHGIAYETVTFPSRDGTKLSGWFFPALNTSGTPDAHNAKGTVIHFHGNAQNITSHWQFVGWLPARGFNVFVFDYRGYGLSEGRPTRRGLFKDSQAALDYVRTRPDVDPTKLLAFGQSLGGNNAIAAIGAGNRSGVRALAVESTFYSYSYIANEHAPGGSLLVGNKYSASKHVASLSPMPLLIIHGTADRVVSYKNALRLFETAKEPKTLVTIGGGRHITAMTNPRNNPHRDALVQFFEDALKTP